MDQPANLLTTPTLDVRLTELNTQRDLHKGLDAVVHGWSGQVRRKRLQVTTLLGEAQEIMAQCEALTPLSDGHLRERMDLLQEQFLRSKKGATAPVIEALALIGQAASRSLGLNPHPVQFACALALHRGLLVELATGEGKTLCAALAGVLAGWRRRPVHIVTANDYLAQRDAEWMGKLYRFCGLQAGYVRGDFSQEQRREAYAADVTYATSKEVIADFLRDRLVLGAYQHPTYREVRSLLPGAIIQRIPVVMRGLHTAIVDEADNLLIDEAVTPVILSAKGENALFVQASNEASVLAADLDLDEHYTLNPAYREVEVLPAGEEKIEQLAVHLPGFWKSRKRSKELIEQALIARHFFTRDKHYVIQDDQLVIVDEFTGRLMPSRTWREGLHQAIEAKEGIPVTDPSETSMRLSVQRFFRFYHELSGMTGTAYEARDEFWQIYQLPVLKLPTHRPILRQHLPLKMFATKAEKWAAVIQEVKALHASGRPILVGVRGVADSEKLSQQLAADGLENQVLNAVRHRDEAEIITRAGQPGHITIATNMAGRGTDIQLARGVAEIGGLVVLSTELYESGRVDRQFHGRCGRQGDPGLAMTFISLEDDLVGKMISPFYRARLVSLLKRGHARPVRTTLLLAQSRSERRAFYTRKSVLKQDDWLAESMAYADGSSAF